MEHYIKKSDVEAEIERRINNLGLTLNEKESTVKDAVEAALKYTLEKLI